MCNIHLSLFLQYLYFCIIWVYFMSDYWLLVGCSIGITLKLMGNSFPFNMFSFSKQLHSNALRLLVHSINTPTNENTDNKYVNAYCMFSIIYWFGNELLNLSDFPCNIENLWGHIVLKYLFSSLVHEYLTKNVVHCHCSLHAHAVAHGLFYYLEP